MSRLDTLTDEKLDKVLSLLHTALPRGDDASVRAAIRQAIAILEGTEVQKEPTDGQEVSTETTQ